MTQYRDVTDPKPSTFQSLAAAATNRRIGAVTLLSFASGMPLGLVWIAIPTWLTRAGFGMGMVGLLTLSQAPWTFKFLWAPLMDAYRLPFLGRKRGWILVTQLGLMAATSAMALFSNNPEFWIIFALAAGIAFLSASQDIVYDGYAVEVLRKDELELASGGRIALYRIGMFVAGSLAITLAGSVSWGAVIALLAVLYVPMLFITWWAPEPEVETQAPTSMREAVWSPLVGFFRTHRALEIAAFIFMYKIADNLAGALVRPFLVQTGFNDLDVGIATGTVGLVSALAGAAIGAVISQRIGLGRALWLFGFLQAASNLGYVAVAEFGLNRPVMYSAMALETLTQNMGSAAFMVLLLRITDRRFSATQFALLTSLMALGRTISGPPAGIFVDALGWTPFFLATIPMAIPGLILLQRFVPFGQRDVTITVLDPLDLAPISRRALWLRGVLGSALGAVTGLAATALLMALRGMRAEVPVAFNFNARVVELLSPVEATDWLRLAGPIVFGLVCGVAVAALTAARRQVE